MILNALTVDVEDYFQVHAFSKTVRIEEWDSFESRVEKNTHLILDLLDSCDAQAKEEPGFDKKQRATFFILGWIAERYPELVKEIHRRGHEVACHGYAHKVIFNQTRNEFSEDVKKAKDILEDLTGEEVIGYRAPTYSINKETLWALEVLFELGFRYDSSIYPIKHDVYGFYEAPRFPFLINFDKNSGFSFRVLNDGDCEVGHTITEVPMTTTRIFGYNFPVAGGGYFRFLPYALTRSFLGSVNRKEERPFIFYIHPWEIDPGIPRLDGASVLSRFRTYVNLDRTENRFKRLLTDFQFSSISNCFQKLIGK